MVWNNKLSQLLAMKKTNSETQLLWSQTFALSPWICIADRSLLTKMLNKQLQKHEQKDRQIDIKCVDREKIMDDTSA